MFRYINMPKLVATYLHEFNTNASGIVSNLYKFIFCLCLPFVSTTFRRARLNALAIAECTNSGEQIKRVVYKITGAEITFIANDTDYEAPFLGGYSSDGFIYNGVSPTVVPFGSPTNLIVANVSLNNASRQEVESVLYLLVPFYVKLKLNYV